HRAVSTAAPAEVKEAAAGDGVSSALRARWEAIKSGDVGNLPVLIGILAITVFFTAKTNIFFTAVNFTNLIAQMAGVTTIAIRVVFVLLIGEIDLSVAYVSAVAGVVVAELQQPGTGHDFPGLVAIGLALLTGVAIGAFQGSFVAFIGVPSFVVTLAGLLAWQGVIIKVLGTQGVIGIQNKQIIDVANYVMPKNWGWAFAIIFAVGFAVTTFGSRFMRRR